MDDSVVLILIVLTNLPQQCVPMTFPVSSKAASRMQTENEFSSWIGLGLYLDFPRLDDHRISG